jgi:hypothetical protein
MREMSLDPHFPEEIFYCQKKNEITEVVNISVASAWLFMYPTVRSAGDE